MRVLVTWVAALIADVAATLVARSYVAPHFVARSYVARSYVASLTLVSAVAAAIITVIWSGGTPGKTKEGCDQGVGCKAP